MVSKGRGARRCTRGLWFGDEVQSSTDDQFATKENMAAHAAHDGS
jgi:hypothetical protein